MQLICMHCNARKCITFRMHTYGNAHECITCSKCIIMQQRMEMHRIIDALKCTKMHQILNALWCNKCNAGKCTLMHRTRMQPTWIRKYANECVRMQQIRNASTWNAMKFRWMQHNAQECIKMRYVRNYTDLRKKLHGTRAPGSVHAFDHRFSMWYSKR